MYYATVYLLDADEPPLLVRASTPTLRDMAIKRIKRDEIVSHVEYSND